MSKSNDTTHAVSDIELMAYLDGEAAGVEAELAAAALSADVDAQRKAEALGQMNDVVRSYLELEADSAEPQLDALWSRIEAGIAEPAPRAQAQVEAEAAPAPSRAAEPGIWARLSAWFEEQRGYFATGALAAAAAALLVVALRPPDVVERVVMVPQPPQQPENPTTLNPPSMVTVSTPPEVEILEVNDGAASVFTLPGEGEDDVTAGVIWLDLDDTELDNPL
ncbi:hypothetical protein [Haliangium ochraceum]|uniref:Uncharacterized protein n=1 Tax=Haliangium ochraceum (strain DSM 14365 / JCM 11303 / SMP-2) TaxID=502025 RepID=D0LU55_HALO1|nr:hypothetical protein [Haliangium ochraceum]ACY17419.1 conserved hypothetical protein [Haliangium ochraceum DSM 14365]